MDFGIDAQRNFAAVGPIRWFAARGAEGEIIVDAVAERPLNLAKGLALESDDVPQVGDPAGESALIRLNASEIALIFEHPSAPFHVSRWPRWETPGWPTQRR